MTEAEIRKQILASAEATGGLTCDLEGRVVWHGLTHEESELMIQDGVAMILKKRSPVDRDRYCELLERHIAARNLAIDLQAQARGKPVN
jgi:hypothetical protein